MPQERTEQAALPQRQASFPSTARSGIQLPQRSRSDIELQSCGRSEPGAEAEAQPCSGRSSGLHTRPAWPFCCPARFSCPGVPAEAEPCWAGFECWGASGEPRDPPDKDLVSQTGQWATNIPGTQRWDPPGFSPCAGTSSLSVQQLFRTDCSELWR